MFGAERKKTVIEQQKMKVYEPGSGGRRSLKDDPQPISNTPAMKRLDKGKEKAMDVEPLEVIRPTNEPIEVIHPSIEPLEVIHPSIIAQPRIETVKKTNKEERLKEINSIKENMEVEKKNEKKEDKKYVKKKPKHPDKNPKDPSPMNDNREEIEELIMEEDIQDNKKIKKRSIPKHIKLISNEPSYSIVKDLNSTPANISYAQLLDVSPKVRADLVKNLKLDKDNPIVNLVHKGKIAISRCKMFDIPSKVYLDYGAGINLISKSYFDKLPNKPQPVGIATCSIVQVLSDSDSKPGLIYNLPLTIGSHTFNANFRLVERDNLLFDIIICYETIIKNYLFINPIILELCKINSNLDTKKINDIANKFDLWEVIENLEKLDRSDETKTEDDLSDGDVPDGALCNLILSMDKSSRKDEENGIFIPYNVGTDEVIFDEVVLFNYNENENKKNDRSHKLNGILSTRIGSNNEDLVKSIRDLLNKFDEIIAISTDDLNETKLLPHSIILKEGSLPVKQRSYRLSKAKADILKEEITKLINKKLIVPSHSTWSSPIVLIQKKNGKWRLCVDYRKLNELTIKDSYSIPFIEEILFSIGGEVKAISTIDLFSGYHQIPMDKNDIEKTSFTTMFGNYNFVVMPFGLTNAPATFQREMNRIFFPLIGKCMFVYIDDLVIFSPSLVQHFLDLEKVFQIIKENGLKINIEKCNFFMKEVEVLGHMLTPNGIKPVMTKVEAIKNWDPPTDVSKLRSFLGIVGYYRKFIPNLSKIAHCLYNLLKKDVPFLWSIECQESFDNLKERLINYPILKYPDFSKQFII